MKKHFLSMHMSRLLVLIFEPYNRQSVSLGLSKYAHLTTCLLTVHDICPKYSGGRKDRKSSKIFVFSLVFKRIYYNRCINKMSNFVLRTST